MAYMVIIVTKQSAHAVNEELKTFYYNVIARGEPASTCGRLFGLRKRKGKKPTSHPLGDPIRDWAVN